MPEDGSLYTKVNISVRTLVEFILRSGDIDSASLHADPSAMQEGSRLHRKLQKAMGPGYRSEVSLKLEVPAEYDGERFILCIEGRADGIYIGSAADADVQSETDAAAQDGQEAAAQDGQEAAEQDGQEADTDGSRGSSAESTAAEDLPTGDSLTAAWDMTGSGSEKDPAQIPEPDPDDKQQAEKDPDRDITYIDEIKTTYMDLRYLEQPVGVHRAQAMCYAYIYGLQQGLEEVGVRMTYCRQETEEVRYFTEILDFEFLESWFEHLTTEYAKWAAWQQKWIRVRNASIEGSSFPFPYREGQRDLVAGVYRTISRKKHLFIEAPTGVGKTMSTVFPAVRTMGEGKISKIFYGTAKTIARTVAEEAFGILIARGMKLKCVTITSKEKLCVLEKPECNPGKCPRAKGHFDRVNDAVYDLLTHEERIDRQLILDYAEKHSVCPFEMCLDVTTWSDAIICDYNYIFDPTVRLRRFFEDGGSHDYCFLVDEAHNLVERARDMYSAEIIKEDLLEAKQALRKYKKAASALEACNRFMLGLKHECDEFEVWDDCGAFAMALLRFVGAYDEISRYLTPEESEPVLDLDFEARHFIEMHDLMDGDYLIYTDYPERGRFRLRLQCMDPSNNLKRCLQQAAASVFFSATLLPVLYYRDQLGGSQEDYCIYAPSPFDRGRRLLMAAGDVSTKYTRRTEDEYARIAAYIRTFVNARKGNYLVFFPSYAMMEKTAEMLDGSLDGLMQQGRSMTEEEKEEFLEAFENEADRGCVGFCVMGGIFSEGIDLKKDSLIGVAVVGTGLPQVCNERELFRGYFDEHKGCGFEYAYLYNGMNKVLQAAGRVIRTTEDVGAILLLDERFLSRQYRALFPREWDDLQTVNLDNIGVTLKNFWDKW